MSSADDPIFFWMNKGDYGWLSQWHHCPFRDPEHPEIVYQTAEHYMMYHKALTFNDHLRADRILAHMHPSQVKAEGRAIANFNKQTWAGKRFDIVIAGNMAKFSAAPLAIDQDRDRELRRRLLDTADRLLVEASPADRIWGIGLDARRAAALSPDKWPGQNLLGKALMEVRRRIREAPEDGNRAPEGISRVSEGTSCVPKGIGHASEEVEDGGERGEQQKDDKDG